MGSTTMQSGAKVVYVGDEEVRQGGVAIMISARAKRALMEWTPISKRFIKARFYSKYKKLTVIQTMFQRMMWWMRKKMNFATSYRTLSQAATDMT